MTNDDNRPKVFYRLFWIGQSGHVLGTPEAIEAASDDGAIAQANQLADGRMVEIWCEKRLVATLNGGERA